MSGSENPEARTLSRRDFLRSSAAAGGTLATASLLGETVAAAQGRDHIVINGLDTSDVDEGFLEQLRAAAVTCSHVSIGGPYNYGPLLRFIDSHPKETMLVRAGADILNARREGKVGFVSGAQSADYMQTLLTDVVATKNTRVGEALRTLYELGLRTQGICYNVASIFGGGCLQPGIALTNVGERLVEEVHKLRIVLDVGGHTGEQTSLDAIAMSSGVPVVCTHTNVAALNPNPRATSNRVLEAIAATGGVIGVTAVSDFHLRNAATAREGPHSPRATLERHLDEYDYLKKLVGVNHVGLGPDFVGAWVHNHDSTDNTYFPAEVLGDGIPQYVQGFESISQLRNVEQGLALRGWTQAELDKLMGGNWLRVYEKVWGR